MDGGGGLVGTVSAKKKAFGFIRSLAVALEVFFHASACDPPGLFESLAVGDAVGFSLSTAAEADGEQQQQQQQQPAKSSGRPRAAAARVWRSKRRAEPAVAVAAGEQLGRVGSYAGGERGSGFLRFLDASGRLGHLTFSGADVEQPAAAGPQPPRALRRGQVVRFQVATDRRAQALQAAGGGSSSSSHARHAQTRAVNVRPLSQEDEVALGPDARRPLAVLEALADVFDADGEQG